MSNQPNSLSDQKSLSEKLMAGNSKEQKVIVLSMKNMPSFKFDPAKSFLNNNPEGGQIFSFKPQQLFQASSSAPHNIQVTQQKVNPNIQAQAIAANKVSVSRNPPAGGTILIRAQSPTSSKNVNKTTFAPLLSGPIQDVQGVSWQQAPINRKVVPDSSTPKLIVTSSIPLNQQNIQIQTTKQNVEGVPTVLRTVKISSNNPVAKEVLPILPNPPVTPLPSRSLIIQKQNLVGVKTVTPVPKWTQSRFSTSVPALAPLQPKILNTSVSRVIVENPDNDEKVMTDSSSDECESASEDNAKAQSTLLKDELNYVEIIESNNDEKPQQQQVEQECERERSQEEEFLYVKQIIEGDSLDNLLEKIHAHKNIIHNDEIEATQVKESCDTVITTTKNNILQQSETMLLCDEQIANLSTPEVSPDLSDKGKNTSVVTPVHETSGEVRENPAVAEVKRNLKLDLISSDVVGEKSFDLEEEDESVFSEDTNVSSFKTGNDESPTQMGKSEMSENLQQNFDMKMPRRIKKKPKNPTLITTLGLPYKPPQPSSRNRKKMEKKIELELDFHDPYNKIQWDDGIGGLNNCNKLFGFDDFGLIEVLDKKDAIAKLSIHSTPEEPGATTTFKSRKHVKPEDQFTCVVCSKLGTIRDFYCPECCSEACLAITKRKALELSAKDENDSGLSSPTDNKRVMFGGEMIPLPQLQQYLLEQQLPDSKRSSKSFKKMMSNTASNVKFSWLYYLSSKSVPAPPLLFKNSIPQSVNPFKVGMKLEAINPEYQRNFYVCTVEEKLGHRIKLHLDGYPVHLDYWVNANSTNIFPVGFCQSTNRQLQVPPKWASKSFDWDEYLASTSADGASRMLFQHLAHTTDENPFSAGMKLEVKYEDNWYAATIYDVLDTRVLIGFDGIYEDFGYFWHDIYSPYLNACNGHKTLEDPSIFLPPFNDETFEWCSYLKATNGVEAPSNILFFRTRQPKNFESGMKLEVVDKINPQLIRPATILCRNEYKIQIIFDGFDISFAYWLDDNSEDIYPINYCEKSGHPIEFPAGYNQTEEAKSPCPMAGCRGIGNGMYHDRYFHENIEECPYDKLNWTKLITQKLHPRSPYKYLSTSKRSTKRASSRTEVVVEKRPKQVVAVKEEISNDDTSSMNVEEIEMPVVEPVKVLKKRGRKRKVQPPPEVPPEETDEARNKKIKTNQTFLENYGPQLSYSFNLWTENSKTLDEATINESDLSKNPLKWSVDDVCTFLVKFCDEQLTAMFYAQKIDGEALLSMSQKDLITLMGIKVGPAIKIYNRILYLRQEVMTNFAEIA